MSLPEELFDCKSLKLYYKLSLADREFLVECCDELSKSRYSGYVYKAPSGVQYLVSRIIEGEPVSFHPIPDPFGLL